MCTKKIEMRNIYIICLACTFGSCSKDDNTSESPTKESISRDIAIDSIQEFTQKFTGGSEKKRLGLDYTYSDFEPTGVYLKPNASLKLNLELIEGSDYPELLVGTYSIGANWYKQPVAYGLKDGINTITANSEGGLVYIRFGSEKPKGKVKIEFQEGWEHSPMYKYDKTTSAVWEKMLMSFEVPNVTLVGNKSFLVISRRKAIAYQGEDKNYLLKTIDEIITVQNDFSGMDGSEEIHKPISHKLMMVEYVGDGYFMFATHYRTAYSSSGAMKYILDPVILRKDGWGPWHEIGHMHQMTAWTWREVTEVTVNLYSLKIEKHFGVTPSRLKREKKWKEIKNYLSRDYEAKDFNASSTNLWVRLGMFFQLQLAFKESFYKELHKHIRKENPVVKSKEDKIRVFMLAACKVSKKDLSGFFKKWGLKFKDSDQVYSEISELGFSVPDSDLTQLQED